MCCAQKLRAFASSPSCTPLHTSATHTVAILNILRLINNLKNRALRAARALPTAPCFHQLFSCNSLQFFSNHHHCRCPRRCAVSLSCHDFFALPSCLAAPCLLPIRLCVPSSTAARSISFNSYSFVGVRTSTSGELGTCSTARYWPHHEPIDARCPVRAASSSLPCPASGLHTGLRPPASGSSRAL